MATIILSKLTLFSAQGAQKCLPVLKFPSMLSFFKEVENVDDCLLAFALCILVEID
jgi:hypothetical protein